MSEKQTAKETQEKPADQREPIVYIVSSQQAISVPEAQSEV